MWGTQKLVDILILKGVYDTLSRSFALHEVIFIAVIYAHSGGILAT